MYEPRNDGAVNRNIITLEPIWVALSVRNIWLRESSKEEEKTSVRRVEKHNARTTSVHIVPDAVVHHAQCTRRVFVVVREALRVEELDNG